METPRRKARAAALPGATPRRDRGRPEAALDLNASGAPRAPHAGVTGAALPLPLAPLHKGTISERAGWTRQSPGSCASWPMPPSTMRPARRPERRSARPARTGIGSTNAIGICHSYTPDGRCVSLLKILLTNYCLFDCAYCVNRRSSNVERARFTVRGGRRPHARILQAQLHRGPVPLVRHHPVARLHDGAADPGREDAAAGARLSRLHPPEDHSRGEPLADRAGGALGGPAVRSTSNCRPTTA